jgi:integrase
MRGTVIKRGTKYVVVVDQGRGADGKRRRHWHSGFGTKRQAESARVDILGRMQRGDYIAPNKVTVAEFAERWLLARLDQVRTSTWESYRLVLHRQVVPALGGILLRDLSPDTLNVFYATMAGRNGRPLAPRTRRYAAMVLRRMLQDAVRWGLLHRNVADLADPPRVTSRREMMTWTISELQLFLDQARGDRLYAAFVVLATTGCRRGECLGLRWEEVNLDAGRMSIVRSLVMTTAGMRFEAPKTNQARVVELGAATASALRDHRRQQLEERLAGGPAYADSGLVFPGRDGSPTRPDNFSRRFDVLVAARGLPRIRLHDLRHTYASLALANGEPVKVVSERLGHANVSTTLNFYAHAIPGMHRDTADRLDALILG